MPAVMTVEVAFRLLKTVSTVLHPGTAAPLRVAKSSAFGDGRPWAAIGAPAFCAPTTAIEVAVDDWQEFVDAKDVEDIRTAPRPAIAIILVILCIFACIADPSSKLDTLVISEFARIKLFQASDIGPTPELIAQSYKIDANHTIGESPSQ